MPPSSERAIQELRGPAALVMAPFDDDLRLDLDALTSNIQFLLDGGLETGKGFIISPCGSGEYLSLSPSEHRDMVAASVEAAAGQIPVVAGAASLNLDEVIALSRGAVDAGAEYVMISPPCYYPISQEGMFEWYRILTESIDAGIMIYDQSWRQEIGTSLGVELIGRLAEFPGIVSLKYGAPNIIEPMVEALDRFADRYAFIDNSLGYTSTLAYMHGATGFISGPATWWPEFELEFFRLLEAGGLRRGGPLARQDRALHVAAPERGRPRMAGAAGLGHHQGRVGLRWAARRTDPATVPRRQRRGTTRDQCGS